MEFTFKIHNQGQSGLRLRRCSVMIILNQFRFSDVLRLFINSTGAYLIIFVSTRFVLCLLDFPSILLFKQFKLLKVNHILQMQEFKFYHKFKNNTLPAYLQHLNLLPNSSIHSHNTRGKTDLHIHRTTHTFAKQCLRQNIPVLLNNAPSSITDKFLTHSIQGFSNYVKNHFVNKYQQHCTIPNCYICQL